MNGQILEYISTGRQDDVMAQNSEMFFEADRLDTEAYKIIACYKGDAATWARFVEAKQIADAQRTRAYQEWMRLKRALR